MHTWLQSQPSLTHCGGTCSRVIQVKVNASEGQTYVFISIILHNNTGFFRGGLRHKKGKTDVIKGHPVACVHIFGKMFIYKPGLKICDVAVAAASSFYGHFGKISLNQIPQTVNRGR